MSFLVSVSVSAGCIAGGVWLIRYSDVVGHEGDVPTAAILFFTGAAMLVCGIGVLVTLLAPVSPIPTIGG